MSSKKFNPFKDFQSDQIQRSSRKIFSAHYACRNAALNLTPVTGTTNVSVKSKLQHAPPGQPPGHLTFLKIIVQIPPYPGQNAVQIPHSRVHSGDQMPPPWGHFTGTKMTEERRKRLQLSNKIFTNITKTEKPC